MKKIFILSFILFITLFAIPVYAQFNLVSQTAVGLEILPEIPGPNEQVRATVQSYGTNLGMADISWYLNGKKELSGKGERVFNFTTGSLNSITNLEVVISTINGETITKTFSVKPTAVDIFWQSDSYTPPFYKGKALFSYQNKITFIAVPHITNSNGVEISPSNLHYKWTRNGTVLENFSGYGKNTYSFIQGIIARPLNIEVEVTSLNDDIAYSNIYIQPVDPIIMFYEKNPLYGFMFQRTLEGTVSLENKKEIEIAAIPYFFGVDYVDDYSLPYKWSINNNTINDSLTKTKRVFRPIEGTSGTSRISLSIENSEKVLQSASNSFDLEFNTTNQNDTSF